LISPAPHPLVRMSRSVPGNAGNSGRRVRWRSELPEGFGNRRRTARFDEVALNPQEDGLADRGAVVHAGAHHELGGTTEGAFAKALQQFQATELGHFDIEKNHVEQPFRVGQQVPGGQTIRNHGHLMLRPLGQNAGEQVAVEVFVFCDQDIHAGWRPRLYCAEIERSNADRAISFSSKWGVLQINTAPMNPVLQLLLEGSQLTTTQIAQVAGLTEAEVNQHLDQLKKDKIFLGWRPVLDLSHEAAAAAVRAVIEVRITPERGGGFNRLAERIGRFDEVESCYLMSGGYDLLLFIKGSSLQKVASFVSEKLSTIEGVLSTSTHFMLRCYKDQGYLFDQGEAQTTRLNVAP